jgi:hypothetical protein
MNKQNNKLSRTETRELRKIIFGLILQHGKLRTTKIKKQQLEQNSKIEIGDLISINKKKISAYIIDNFNIIDFDSIDQGGFVVLNNENIGVFFGFENLLSQVPMCKIFIDGNYYLVSLFDIKKK